ncbi:MAG: GNAT family N-acetyltransferase [Hyphomicrobiales bacterium]|nr:GNAT family N-acetyltransferase [Hyphomicrobiales bacterium]
MVTAPSSAISSRPIALRIRRVRDRDIAALVTLYQQAWHAAYDPVDGVAWVDSMCEHLLGGDSPLMFALRPDDIALVATRFGRILGSVRAHRLPDAAFLSGFYMLPGQTRRGIGRALFGEVLALLPADEPVLLNVRPTSTGARSFYRGLGFREIGSGVEDLGGGHMIDVVTMRHDRGQAA